MEVLEVPERHLEAKVLGLMEVKVSGRWSDRRMDEMGASDRVVPGVPTQARVKAGVIQHREWWKWGVTRQQASC
jgi:hypothetical protein